MSLTTHPEITTYLELQSELVNKRLNELFPPHRGHYEHLFEAARYSLMGGGKRLRPILALATANMLGANQEFVLTPACTLEIVHTYSLIHDDLPCMDDDDFRRGKPSLHKKYSEGHAVLTGDYLLTYAFELLAKSPHLNADVKLRLISTLSQSIGADGMIGGQVMDLAYEGKKIPLDTLKLLHRKKTGALITAAIEFGGILANVNEKQMEHLRLFGENIGLAFQIIDDVLDVTSSQTKHGRPVSSDVLNEKSTYVQLLGLEQSKAYAQECYNQALQYLKFFPNQAASPLRKLAEFMIHRNH